MFKSLKILWEFSRPHTIIGSFLSITTLYLLACKGATPPVSQALYAWTLLSALGCNIFITGLNQITDRDMDVINKPFLPIAKGVLSVQNAYKIIVLSLLVGLWSAWMAAPLLFEIIVAILVIGTAYSLPPLRLKRHHITAALCIVLVRGVLVNFAIGAAMDQLINGSVKHWKELTLLTIFVSIFSLAIAWFKDLYDTEGDKMYKIKTFPLQFTISTAYWLGSTLVALAYVFGVIFSWVAIGNSGWLLTAGHGVLLALFLYQVFRASYTTRSGIYQFYMRFWVFFFSEYGLFLVYSLI